mmetsp:Transcript_21023/g.37854  ORF Transcript_21023/g.37854 Transcript_21023/m.37854 type:complete len:105 (-) Transcript_21023:963-1277(-)
MSVKAMSMGRGSPVLQTLRQLIQLLQPLELLPIPARSQINRAKDMAKAGSLFLPFTKRRMRRGMTDGLVVSGKSGWKAVVDHSGVTISTWKQKELQISWLRAGA